MTRLLVTAAVMAALAACGGGAADAPAAVTQADEVAWRPLGTWSGRGHRQTESFTSETGNLRARWETTEADPDGAFSLTIHSAISGRALERIVEHRGQGKGTAYLYEDPRVFHAVVDSAGVDWTVTIEEAVRGAAVARSEPVAR